MITDSKVREVNAAMAAARAVFDEELCQANDELVRALSQHVPAGEALANWNLIEAHNCHRNRIEAAAFTLRLAFLKCAGRRE